MTSGVLGNSFLPKFIDPAFKDAESGRSSSTGRNRSSGLRPRVVAPPPEVIWVIMGQAALTGSSYNVRINILDLNTGDAEVLLTQLASLEERAAAIQAELKEILSDRGGLSLE